MEIMGLRYIYESIGLFGLIVGPTPRWVFYEHMNQPIQQSLEQWNLKLQELRDWFWYIDNT